MATKPIRDYLISRGLNDNDITYDNGTVLAKGKRFMDATPQADGRTYADIRQLDNAFSDYDMRDQLAQLKTKLATPNTETTALQQQLKDRINKPIQQFSYNQNTDPAYQAALQSARQNTQTAAGNIAADMNKRGLLNSTITQDRGNQAAAQEYNRVSSEVLPQLMQQAYQRYLGQHNLENQQIGNMLAYTDYLDRSGQQQFRNQFDLLGQQNTMTQQDRDNQYRGDVFSDKQKQDRIALANYLTTTYGIQADPKMDSQVAYDQVKGLTPLAMMQHQQQKAIQEAGITGQYNGQSTMDREKMLFDQGAENRRIGISAASAANSASNANFSRLMDVWKATGKAPAGLESMGIQAGTSFNDGKSSAQLDKEMQGLFAGLNSGQIDPARAIDEIKIQLSAGMYTPTDASAMINLIQQFSNSKPQQPMPQMSAQQQNELNQTGGKNYSQMSQRELEQEWSTDPSGKASGTPMMDWSAWVRDPRGRMAGTSFNSYQQAYGPRLGR